MSRVSFIISARPHPFHQEKMGSDHCLPVRGIAVIVVTIRADADHAQVRPVRPSAELELDDPPSSLFPVSKDLIKSHCSFSRYRIHQESKRNRYATTYAMQFSVRFAPMNTTAPIALRMSAPVRSSLILYNLSFRH